MLKKSVAQLAILFGLFAWLHVVKMVELLISASPAEFTLEYAPPA